MRNRLTAMTAGILFLGATGIAAAQTVVITPEQETVVRQYVVEQRVEPAMLPADIVVAEGTVLPETVELRTLDVPEIEVEYSYVVADRRIVLVEPATRRIVRVIDYGNGNGNDVGDDIGEDTEDGVENDDDNGDGDGNDNGDGNGNDTGNDNGDD